MNESSPRLLGPLSELDILWEIDTGGILTPCEADKKEGESSGSRAGSELISRKGQDASLFSFSIGLGKDVVLS